MGWQALIPVLIENAPAIIDTATKFFDWAKATVGSAVEAYNKPAEEITADELLAHIKQIQAQSDEIQSL